MKENAAEQGNNRNGDNGTEGDGSSRMWGIPFPLQRVLGSAEPLAFI